MKQLLVFIAVVLTPSICSSGDLNILEQGDGTIINGRMYPGTATKGRIYYKVRQYQDHTTAVQFATSLCRSSHWRFLTAIAEQESGFAAQAVGKAGDSGAFQVLPHEWGGVPATIPAQCRQASMILAHLLKQHKNSLQALRAYNGSLRNPKTLRYAQKVLHRAILI